MYTINDPVFGKLERHRQTWRGSHWFEYQQQNLEIELEYIEGKEPSLEEHQVFLDFLENQHARMQAIEKAVFHYLIENTEHYRSHHETSPESQVPTLQNSSEVWQHLRILRLYIDTRVENCVEIRIVCDFDWDSEHGLDIELRFDQIGIAEGGAHWSDKTHYGFEGNPIK
jgi:hypothetical protein